MINSAERSERAALCHELMGGSKLSNKTKNRILKLSGLPVAEVQELVKTPDGRKQLAEKLIGKEIWGKALKKRRPKGGNDANKLRIAQLYQESKAAEKTSIESIQTLQETFRHMSDESLKRIVRQGRKVHPPLSLIPEGIQAVAASLLRQYSKYKD